MEEYLENNGNLVHSQKDFFREAALPSNKQKSKIKDNNTPNLTGNIGEHQPVLNKHLMRKRKKTRVLRMISKMFILMQKAKRKVSWNKMAFTSHNHLNLINDVSYFWENHQFFGQRKRKGVINYGKKKSNIYGKIKICYNKKLFEFPFVRAKYIN